MPPKAKAKDAGPVERPILGRFSSHLKIGIVGLPNVGKSTLFNTLTKLSIPAENFPFCTIEPNEARVNIPDDRFDWLCQLYKPKSEIPAFLEIHDIAGLVRGAHEGQGLGNNFLSHIRAVDGIFHVLRAFEDPDIIHVDDIVDPVRDLETITEELRLKDIEFIKKKIEDVEKSMKRSNDKALKVELELLLKVKAWLEEGKDVRFGDWKAADIEILNTFQLLSAKPVVYLINMNERDYQRKKNKFLPKIHAWVQEHGGDTMIPFSGVFERTLADMLPDEAAKYCEENKLQSALPRIIKTGFSAINLIYFFTAGPDEVKCWQIRRQSKAPQAAGAIHTDFERGFICAEVMKFEDLKELGNETAVKGAGKYRQEGKTYVVQDGDIIFFKFNMCQSRYNRWFGSTGKRLKRKQTRSRKRIDYSTQLHASRINHLQSQDDIVTSMKDSVAKDLLRVSNNKKAYKKLSRVSSLRFVAAERAISNKVVESIIEDAKKHYAEKAKVASPNKTIEEKVFLPPPPNPKLPDSHDLHWGGGKIVCKNTLDIDFRKKLPQKIKIGLYEEGIAFVKFVYIKGNGLVTGDDHGKITSLGAEEIVLENGEYLTGIEDYYRPIPGAPFGKTVLSSRRTKGRHLCMNWIPVRNTRLRRKATRSQGSMDELPPMLSTVWKPFPGQSS
ncbi:unnamed protein product [Brassica rapa]|uniref:Obg-like ATPase 1 n=1 Tax=Brassica campestris TaxID=3711 RepID=A0A8D9HMV0_BRACM|nr:unnamed protein product [Brassica rapa]